MMATKTWEVNGAKLFGETWLPALQTAIAELVREAIAVGETKSVHEIAQLISVACSTPFETDERKRLIDAALESAKEFERCPPQHCSVKGIVVKTIWRRTR
jgi:hypothetical protein